MKKSSKKQLKTLLSAVKSKRARAVIEQIIKHGKITTEELEKMGYSHPPRAARDVRENGIPLKTIRVKSSSGKSIGAYVFDEEQGITPHKRGGRMTFSLVFKKALMDQQGNKCAICNEEFESRYLQIDHRVPYEVSGDSSEELDLGAFMLVCGTCNRKKSWSCEHCLNFQKHKKKEICQSCYWATPLQYDHIAMEQIRRCDLVWKGDKVTQYDTLKMKAETKGSSVQKLILEIVEKQDRTSS